MRNDDEVAQWENGEIEFVKPMEIISQKYKGEMIQITNQHINLCMTPEHRCLLKSRKSNKWTVVSAKNYLMDARQLHSATRRQRQVSDDPPRIRAHMGGLSLPQRLLGEESAVHDGRRCVSQ